MLQSGVCLVLEGLELLGQPPQNRSSPECFCGGGLGVGSAAIQKHKLAAEVERLLQEKAEPFSKGPGTNGMGTI